MRNLRKQAGFTLLEVVISAAIVALVALMVARALTGNMKNLNVSQEIATAGRVAASVLEDYQRHLSDDSTFTAFYDQTVSSTLVVSVPTETVGNTTFTPGISFWRNTSGGLQVEAAVSWTSMGGQSHTVNVGAMLTEDL